MILVGEQVKKTVTSKTRCKEEKAEKKSVCDTR